MVVWEIEPGTDILGFSGEDDVFVPAVRDGGGPGSAGEFAGLDHAAHVINESKESKDPKGYIRLCDAWEAGLRFVCEWRDIPAKRREARGNARASV
jgi:hypothetical protein